MIRKQRRIWFAFSLFVKPLQAEFEWTRSNIMGAFTCLYLTLAITSPFAGKAVDRFGAKSVMALGGAVMAMGFALLFALKSPLHFYIGNIIVGIGGSAAGPISGTAVVSDWFREKRGLAIGIMSTGIGLGGFVVAPLLGAGIIPAFGWRMGYLFMSILACPTIPLALLVIKKSDIDTTLVQNAPNRVTTGKDGQMPFSGRYCETPEGTPACYLSSGPFKRKNSRFGGIYRLALGILGGIYPTEVGRRYQTFPGKGH